MNERTYNYPGKINAEELERIRRDAAAANLTPAAYMRKRMRLKGEVKNGAPLRNKNAKKNQE